MGSTGIMKSMAETKKMLIKDFTFSNEKLTSTVLGQANGAGGMWILQGLEFKDDRGKFTSAIFVMMNHYRGETIYKEISIDSGPSYYDCPESWLNRITPQGEWGIGWMEKARNVHRVKKIQIVPGMKFTFHGRECETRYKYNTHSWAIMMPEGLRKISNTRLQECLAKIHECDLPVFQKEVAPEDFPIPTFA